MTDHDLVSMVSLGGSATGLAIGHGEALHTFTPMFLERDNCEVVCKFLGHLCGVGRIQRFSGWQLSSLWRMQ